MPTEKYKIYIPQEMKTSLIYDAELFEFIKSNGRVNLNSFLKTLLVNYYSSYVAQRTKMHSDIVTEIVRATGIKTSKAEGLATTIIMMCKDSYVTTHEKNEAITLTVSGKAYEVLGLIEQNLEGVFSLSQYVRNLFSAYLSMSRSSREEIIFLDEYSSIMSAIENKRMISFSSTSSGKLKHLAAPYSLIPSKEEQFNYLLCYNYEKKAVSSFRLSRIRRLLVHPETFQLQNDVIEKLKKAKEKGPQFAFEETPRTYVRLTEEGMRKYRMIYTNRPEVITMYDNILTFEWPLIQLEEYFKRFGKDAEILEPESAREQLREFYKDAYELYSRENRH
ncbi:MAG: WYL domain-containing protein [Lachnospiraceae bacterium]|nr:WYL domain-containing protein [Lachnospiraceae bacterium]